MTVSIDTDLVTPLAAYLRLRDGAAARRSCSSRSTRDGSAAIRSSAAAIASSRSRRPSAPTSRSSATSATTTSRSSSRRCRCPQTGLTSRRAGSSSPTSSCASTTSPARPTCCTATRRRSPTRSPARRAVDRRAGAGSGRDGARPRPRRARAPASRAAQEHIRRGDAFQIVLSQRAERPTDGVPARRLPRAPAHQPVAVPLPARARRPRTRRLVARDARQGRRTARASLNPIAGTTERGDGDAERLLTLGEGSRRARDARRPRPQRPLARLRAGHGQGRALPRARALLARHAPRLGGRRRAADGRDAVRRAAGDVPGRHRLRRAEGARDADHLRARGLPSRHLRGRRRLPRCPGVGARHVHRDPHRRPARRPRATCRPAAGSSPTPTRPPSTRSA